MMHSRFCWWKAVLVCVPVVAFIFGYYSVVLLAGVVLMVVQPS